jgi:transposase
MIQVRTLKDEGLTQTAIAERLGLHRQTVARYLERMEQAENSGQPIETIACRAARVHAIDPYLEHLRTRRTAYPELSAKRLHHELWELGFRGSRRTVRRYVAGIKAGLPRRVYQPYETGPGEQGQVDWGYEIWEHDGQSTKIYSFVFVLSHSRVCYVEYVTSLDSVVFLNCLYRAFEYIGGIPQIVLFDNAKVVVSERVGRVIRFQADLLDLAARLGFRPEACWVQDPETKGKVESTVGYVHRDFYYGRTVTDLASLNQEVRAWCDTVNQTVHTTTRMPPWERWVAEQPHLRPLPAKRPALFRVQSVQVTKQSLFTFRQNQYSVPKDYARRRIRLEIYEDAFEAKADDQVLGRWPRTSLKGPMFLDPAHYDGRFTGLKRSALEHQFRTLCPRANAYLEGLAQTRGASLRDQMQQIVALGETYSSAELDEAMARGIQYGNYGYGSLHRILKTRRATPEALPDTPTPSAASSAPLPEVAVEVRDPAYYAAARRSAAHG